MCIRINVQTLLDDDNLIKNLLHIDTPECCTYINRVSKILILI